MRLGAQIGQPEEHKLEANMAIRWTAMEKCVWPHIPAMARIRKGERHLRSFRSLKLRACLGFASSRQMRRLRSEQSETATSPSCVLSQMIFEHSNARGSSCAG